ncbi:MAG: hypothetical protein J2P19_30225 [Pseudonocardia sp.]|nr:hypothetical protein [Pseudonocardia sp.]
MTGLVVMLVLVMVAVLAPRYGVDTRDGRDWRVDGGWSADRPPTARHTVGSDVRALASLLRGVGRRLARAWDARERAWGAGWRPHQPWRGDNLSPHRRDDPPPGWDELRWRQESGGWRLHGRMLPLAPPEGEPSARRD